MKADALSVDLKIFLTAWPCNDFMMNGILLQSSARLSNHKIQLFLLEIRIHLAKWTPFSFRRNQNINKSARCIVVDRVFKIVDRVFKIKAFLKLVWEFSNQWKIWTTTYTCMCVRSSKESQETERQYSLCERISSSHGEISSSHNFLRMDRRINWGKWFKVDPVKN